MNADLSDLLVATPPKGGQCKIKQGATVWRNFSKSTWPNIPNGEINTVFKWKRSGVKNTLMLTADHFGLFLPKGNYGAGPLLVNENDVIPAPIHLTPIEK